MGHPELPAQRRFIQVCQYRSCQRFQSEAVLAALKHYAGEDLMVAASACLGQCGSGPTVRVLPDNVWYCRVRPGDVGEIVDQHIGQGKPVKRLLHSRFHPDYAQLLERLSAPDEAAPDKSAPDEAVPDEAVPDESASDEAAPTATVLNDI